MAEYIDLGGLGGAELATLALANGWEVERTMLFDEEGVEGWHWSKGDASVYCVANGDTPVADSPARMAIVPDLASLEMGRRNPE